MSNFSYLSTHPEYSLFANSAIEAEKVFSTSPAMCAVGCRKALELAVKWVYAADKTITMPYKDNLQSLLHEPSFRFAVDRNVWSVLPSIVKAGNLAVHTGHSVSAADAVFSLRGLFDFIQWVDYCYGTDYVERSFDETAIPGEKVTLDEKKIREQESLLTQKDVELEALRKQVESLSAAYTASKQQNQQSRSFTAADLTEAEAALLSDYVTNGGKLLVVTDFTTDTPRLDAILESCGMTRQAGLLIENDANHYPYGYPQTYLLPTVQSNEITAGVGSNMMVYTPIAQGIVKHEDGDYTFTSLLSTSSTAYSMEGYATAETAQKADTDPEGSFDVALAAENTTTGTRVVWINCPNFLQGTINQSVSGGNAQLLGSIVNWFDGEQTTAVISGKSLSAASLTVPNNMIIVLGLLFTIVLPIVCVVAGLVICVIRRRR